MSTLYTAAAKKAVLEDLRKALKDAGKKISKREAELKKAREKAGKAADMAYVEALRVDVEQTAKDLKAWETRLKEDKLIENTAKKNVKLLQKALKDKTAAYEKARVKADQLAKLEAELQELKNSTALVRARIERTEMSDMDEHVEKLDLPTLEELQAAEAEKAEEEQELPSYEMIQAQNEEAAKKEAEKKEAAKKPVDLAALEKDEAAKKSAAPADLEKDEAAKKEKKAMQHDINAAMDDIYFAEFDKLTAIKQQKGSRKEKSTESFEANRNYFVNGSGKHTSEEFTNMKNALSGLDMDDMLKDLNRMFLFNREDGAYIETFRKYQNQIEEAREATQAYIDKKANAFGTKFDSAAKKDLSRAKDTLEQLDKMMVCMDTFDENYRNYKEVAEYKYAVHNNSINLKALEKKVAKRRPKAVRKPEAPKQPTSEKKAEKSRKI